VLGSIAWFGQGVRGWSRKRYHVYTIEEENIFFIVYMLSMCYLDCLHSVSKNVSFKIVEFYIGKFIYYKFLKQF